MSAAVTTDPITAFRKAMTDAGLSPPDDIISDGVLHRFATNGQARDRAGYYVLHGDGITAGIFGDWRTGVKEKWCAKSAQDLTPSELQTIRERMQAMQAEREDNERVLQAEAAIRAEHIWQAAPPAPANHPYLVRKGVKPHTLRAHADGRLIVPIRRGGRLISLQFIDADGGKRYLLGGEKRGGSHALTQPNTTHQAVVICEGYATGASIFEATGLPTVVALDAANLAYVAQSTRDAFADVSIVIAGDNDIVDGKPNTGLIAATEAAKAVGGFVAVPEMGGQKCDWNDAFLAQGPEAVARGMKDAKQLTDAEADQTSPDTEQTAQPAAQPLASILDEIYTFLGRFVSYPSEHAKVAHTLWVAHTHFMDKWDSTPRIAFLSPEPGSGKSRALEITETLVPRPIESVNATPAYLFRKISSPEGLPTILYDEIDTIFGPRAKENEELRGVINAGHRKGATAGRCVIRGKAVETEELPAYCAVAMAGLGNLPDTILSRSVVIRMRRRAPHETVSPYRRKVHGPEGGAIRGKLERWTKENGDKLKVDPAMPDGITDRNADVWEALLAIADAAGGNWPNRARVSAVSLVSLSVDNGGSLGVRLLADLRTIFGGMPAMFTADILDGLMKIEESPWGTLRGRPLDAYGLAKLLKPYGCTPLQIRIGDCTQKGYQRESLIDAWDRYIPKEKAPQCPPKSETSETGETAPGKDSPLSPAKRETSETSETPSMNGTHSQPEEVIVDAN